MAELPHDIWIVIFHILGPEFIKTIRLVCKEWKQILQECEYEKCVLENIVPNAAKFKSFYYYISDIDNENTLNILQPICKFNKIHKLNTIKFFIDNTKQDSFTSSNFEFIKRLIDILPDNAYFILQSIYNFEIDDKKYLQNVEFLRNMSRIDSKEKVDILYEYYLKWYENADNEFIHNLMISYGSSISTDVKEYIINKITKLTFIDENITTGNMVLHINSIELQKIIKNNPNLTSIKVQYKIFKYIFENNLLINTLSYIRLESYMTIEILDMIFTKYVNLKTIEISNNITNNNDYIESLMILPSFHNLNVEELIIIDQYFDINELHFPKSLNRLGLSSCTINMANSNVISTKFLTELKSLNIEYCDFDNCFDSKTNSKDILNISNLKNIHTSLIGINVNIRW